MADGESLTYLSFSLNGEVPSKKNSWKPKAGGGMYIPKDVQTQIDAFLWQLKPIKNQIGRPVTGSVSITVNIITNIKKQDTDNRYTTIQDILQKAQIIKNDNDVDEFHCRRIFNSLAAPVVNIIIYAS